MQVPYRYLRFRIAQAGLFPASKLAWAAWYVLAIDLLLVIVQTTCSVFKWKFGESLAGWVTFLTMVAMVLFSIVALRWIRAKMLWRLRNRLIITYVFIGVIPVVLLMILALGSFYLFAGQFATFIVTSELNSELSSLEAANSAIAHQLAAHAEGGNLSVAAAKSLRVAEKTWPNREVSIWLNRKVILSAPANGALPPTLPDRVQGSFNNFVRDRNQLYLRAAQDVSIPAGTLTVLSSEPFDLHLLQKLANNLGEITLYASGLSLRNVDASQAPKPGIHVSEQSSPTSITLTKPGENVVLDTGKGNLKPTLTAGSVPPPTRALDRGVTFVTTVYVVDWDSGDTSSPAGISVQTRVSKLYDRLFSALGDFAPAIEFLLLVAAIVSPSSN